MMAWTAVLDLLSRLGLTTVNVTGVEVWAANSGDVFIDQKFAKRRRVAYLAAE